MASNFGIRDGKMWIRSLNLIDANGVKHELTIDTTGDLCVDGKKINTKRNMEDIQK